MGISEAVLGDFPQRLVRSSKLILVTKSKASMVDAAEEALRD
jgi:hypothetical protein